MASTPTRVDEDLFEAAKAVAQTQSRSATAQINHWARIGRELESSHAVSHAEIADVLTGARPYDTVGAREQAIVRAAWDEDITELATGLNLEEEFRASGEQWSEADSTGRLVIKPDDQTSAGA